MTFPRIRMPGTWVLGSVLAPNEEEALDDHQSNAIDGRDGGTYVPTAAIVLGATSPNTLALHTTAHATFDSFDGHITAGFLVNVDADGGIALAGTSGHPATITFGSNSLLTMAGGAQLLATDTMISFGAATTISAVGTSGFPTTLTLGAYTTTSFTGTSAANANVGFGAYSSTLFQGSSSSNAIVAFGQYSTTTWNTGAAATFQTGTTLQFDGTMTVGEVGHAGQINIALGAVEFISGTTLQVDSGATLLLEGAFQPSGANGIVYLRDPVTGPSTTSTLTPTAQDIILCPIGLSGNINWTLPAGPAHPYRLWIVQRTAPGQGGTIKLYDNLGVQRISFLAGPDNNSIFELLWDGVLWQLLRGDGQNNITIP